MATQTSRGMSLKELEDKASESIVAGGTPSEVFGILMNWFNDQIKADFITQDELLLEGFVSLLQTPFHAGIGTFSLTQVDETFNRWLERDAVEDPAYRRRYLIMQQDVHQLFANGKQHIQALDDFSPSGQYNGQAQNDTLPFLFEQRNDNMRAEGNTGLSNNTGHDASSDAIRHDRSTTEAESIEVVQPDQANIPFDAGTIAPLGTEATHPQDANIGDPTITRGTIITGSSQDSKMTRKASRASRRDHKRKVQHVDPELSALPKNYVCKRCNEPGKMTAVDGARSLLTFSQDIGFNTARQISILVTIKHLTLIIDAITVANGVTISLPCVRKIPTSAR